MRQSINVNFVLRATTVIFLLTMTVLLPFTLARPKNVYPSTNENHPLRSTMHDSLSERGLQSNDTSNSLGKKNVSTFLGVSTWKNGEQHQAQKMLPHASNRNYLKSPFSKIQASLNEKMPPSPLSQLSNVTWQDNRYLVKLSPKDPQATNLRTISSRITSTHRIKVNQIFNSLSLLSIEGSLAEIRQATASLPVEYIIPDQYIQAVEPEWNDGIHQQEFKNGLLSLTNPAPSWFGSEDRIGARELQAQGITGKGVVIGIIDTGIDRSHPDLDDLDNNPLTSDPKVIYEASFIDYDADGIVDELPFDENGHGTHVAGIIAANGLLKGVAPEAKLVNLRVFDSSGSGRFSWIIAAVEHAIALGYIDVLSLSLGAPPYFTVAALEDVLEQAWDAGIVVVVSAGNGGPNRGTLTSPATARKVISVGATNALDHVTGFSSRGPSPWGIHGPDVVAPGDLIISTIPGGAYSASSGTSMAAPHVAGAAALLLSVHENATPSDIKLALLRTARDLKESPLRQGQGLIDVKAAHEFFTLQAALLSPSYSLQPEVHYISPGETFSLLLQVISRSPINFSAINPQVEGNLSTISTVQGSFDITTTDTIGFLELTIQPPLDGRVGNRFVGTVKLLEQAISSVEFIIIIDAVQNDSASSTDAPESFLDALLVSSTTTVKGELIGRDTIDVYAISMPANVEFTIRMDILTPRSDFDLIILDYEGTWLGTSTNWDDESEIITFETIQAGIHYIFIYQFEGQGSYQVYVSDSSPSSVQKSVLSIDNLSWLENDRDGDGSWDEIQVGVTVSLQWVSLLADTFVYLAVGLESESALYYQDLIHAGNAFIAGTTGDNDHLILRFNISTSLLLSHVAMGYSSFRVAYVSVTQVNWESLDSVSDVKLNAIVSRQYKVSDFDADRHVTFSNVLDEAMDNDGDGLLDVLRVSFSMTAWQGAYMNERVGISAFWDVKQENLLYSSGTPWSVDVSVKEGETKHYFIEIAGDALHGAKIDGMLLILGFRVSWEPFSQVIVNHTTNSRYSSSEFSRNLYIAVTDDKGIDDDGDGFFEALQLTIDVKVLGGSNGFFQLVGWWLFGTGNQRGFLPHEFPSSRVFQRTIGESYQITLEYSGLELHESKADGPYWSFGVVAIDDRGFYLEDSGPIVTRAYNSSEFKLPPQSLVNVTLELKDSDDNGKKDVMEVKFYLLGTSTGQVEVEYRIIDEVSGGRQYSRIFRENVAFVAPNELIMFSDDVSIRSLVMLGYQGRLMIEYVALRNDTNGDNSLITSYLLVAESQNIDFSVLSDALPLSLLKVSDQVLDRDGNLLFDEYVITLQVSVLKPSSEPYLFEVLIASRGVNSYTSQFVKLSRLGLTEISLVFSSDEIFFLRNDGPWKVDVHVSDSNFDLFIGYKGISSPLQFDLFDPHRSAVIVGIRGDKALDTDDDSKSEFIEVEVEVMIFETGMYVLQSDVWAEPPFFTKRVGTYVISFYVTKVNSSVRWQRLKVSFFILGADVLATGVEGELLVFRMNLFRDANVDGTVNASDLQDVYYPRYITNEYFMASLDSDGEFSDVITPVALSKQTLNGETVTLEEFLLEISFSLVVALLLTTAMAVGFGAYHLYKDSYAASRKK